MFSWFSSLKSKEVEDKCAPNPDDVSRDLKELVWDGLRETVEETAKDLFSEKPDGGVVDAFNKIDSVGGFFNKSADKIIDYFNDSIEKERMCRKEEEAKEPEMPEPEPAPVSPPRPTPITPQFVNVQGRWMGPQGVVQDHYDPSNCGGGNNNGNDHGVSLGNDRGLDLCFSSSDTGPIDNCRSGRTYD